MLIAVEDTNVPIDPELHIVDDIHTATGCKLSVGEYDFSRGVFESRS